MKNFVFKLIFALLLVNVFVSAVGLAIVDPSSPLFEDPFQPGDELDEDQSGGGLGEDPTVFYRQIREGAVGPKCFNVSGGPVKQLINCTNEIIKAIQPIAALLFALAITISGAYLIFSPANQRYIETAKTILIWTTIGFVIIFGYDIIKGLIEEIAR